MHMLARMLSQTVTFNRRRAAAIIAGKLPPNYKSRPCKAMADKARECERRSHCWSFHSNGDRLPEVKLRHVLCPILLVRSLSSTKPSLLWGAC